MQLVFKVDLSDLSFDCRAGSSVVDFIHSLVNPVEDPLLGRKAELQLHP
jgi:hypothetical protein